MLKKINFFLLLFILKLNFLYINFESFCLKFNFISNSLLILSFFIFYLIFFINKNFFIKNNLINFLILFYFLFLLLNFFNTNSIIKFFLFYELLLLPSILIVFFLSPNKRFLSVSFYFFIWTQLGSFLVFLGIFFLYKIYNINNFYNFDFILFNNHYLIFSLFIFIGFSIKIPIWPFYFWLTKTHVEANTSFSIFLSGILIKVALFSIFKFFFILKNILNFYFFFIFITIFDICFKIKFQIDFKKVIAFLTVQEMSLILIFICYFNSYLIKFLIIFIFLHTFFSGLYFFFSEIIYKKVGSRKVNNFLNFLNLTPLFFFLLYFTSLIFIGLPLSIKFFIEIIILNFFSFSNFVIFLFFLIFLQFFTILLFFKKILIFSFGFKNLIILDLNKNDLFLILIFLLPINIFFFL